MAQVQRVQMGRVWEDMALLVRTHRDDLVALAGVFLFIPHMAINLFVPPPKEAPAPEKFAEILLAHYADYWPALVSALFVLQVGGLAMLVLVLGKSRDTLGGGLKQTFRLVPSLVGINLVVGITAMFAALVTMLVAGILAAMFGGGPSVRLLFIVLALMPVVYLSARTMLSTATLAEDPQSGPVNAVVRSFHVTRSNGWAVLGGFMLVLLVVMVGGMVVGGLLGVISGALPDPAGPLVSALVNAAISTVSGVLTALYVASTYRQLAGSDPQRSSVQAG